MIITLLRKPLEGSVADNALKHGCGAINIDGNRIPTGDQLGRKGLPHHKGPYSNKVVWSSSSTSQIDQTNRTDGRWPANFILIHKEGCELRGTKKVKGHKGYPNGPGGIWSKKYQEEHQKDRSLTDVKTVKDNEVWMGHADKDGKEEIADWDCVEGCPVKELDQQSGHLKSTTRKPTGNQIYPTSNTSVTWNANNVMDTTQRGFNDEGGASRFFKQFQKEGDQ